MIFQIDSQGTGHEQKIQRNRAKGLKNMWGRELKRCVYWDHGDVVSDKTRKRRYEASLTRANQKHDFGSVRDSPYTTQDPRPVR